MKVTVTTLSDYIFMLDVSEDLELENFIVFCEVETGIRASEIVISFNGQVLGDRHKSLKQLGIKDGDVVILQHMVNSSSSSQSLPPLDFSNIFVPGSSQPPPLNYDEDPAMIRDMLLSNPEELALLKTHNAPLADALLSGNFQEFSRVLREQLAQKQQRLAQKQRLLTADPFDVEAQRLIAEEIRRKNIDANMQAAIEYNPEAFGTVVMLYINCRVNGYPVKAFIDSGAQATIMSAACAERCHIMRLVDQRFQGVAKGVGVQKIIGRIHMVQIQIENDYLTTSFSVLEDQRMDMLLGLDMLRRHQCIIDLKRTVLQIGTTGTETRFLSENELPQEDRLTHQPESSASIRELEDAELARALSDSAAQQASSSAKVPRNPSIEILSTDPFNETDVRELVSLGFTREQVIAELRRFKGDKTQATAALFAKSLKF